MSVRPSAASSANREWMVSALAGSTPASGSSSSSTAASWTSARAMSTRWRWPPDRAPYAVRSSPDRPTRASAARAASRSRRRAGSHQRPASEPMTATSRALTGKSSRAWAAWATCAGRPWIRTVPAASGSWPISARKRVVLPPPLGPSTHTELPASAAKDTPLSTGSPP